MKAVRVALNKGTRIESQTSCLAFDLGQAQAASYVREIAAACRELAAGTRTYHAIDEIRPGYRKAHVRSHVVYFTVSDDVSDVLDCASHEQMLHNPFYRVVLFRSFLRIERRVASYVCN